VWQRSCKRNGESDFDSGGALATNAGLSISHRSIEGAQMTCYVMLEFTAKKGFGPDLLAGLGAALPTTRSKDGCLSLELTINQDNSDNMIIVMRWQSRKHYETYRAWREERGDVKRFADVTESGLSTRFFDVADA
jgi:quinol monooxygenase YgiN